MVVKLTTSARRRIGRGVRAGLHRGGAALGGFRDDPEAAERVVRVAAAGGALIVMLLRARDGGAVEISGYQRHRASAEQVIRDVCAVGALLALALRRRKSVDTGNILTASFLLSQQISALQTLWRGTMVDNLAATHAPASGSTSRGMNITLWVLQGITALGFVFSGLMKLTGSAQALAVFEAMGTAGWMPYVIGGLELLGAIGLLIPRLSGTAAVAFVALTAGALICHSIWGGFAAPAVVMLILAAVVAYGRRSTTSALITGASHR
ncbi:MAG: DoxX family protein [Pseudonocardiaceae bacterium]